MQHRCKRAETDMSALTASAAMAPCCIRHPSVLHARGPRDREVDPSSKTLVGPLLAQALLTARACAPPEPVEDCPALAIEPLDGSKASFRCSGYTQPSRRRGKQAAPFAKQDQVWIA